MRNYLSTVTPHNTHTQLKHTHNFEIPGATGSHPEGAGSILRRAGDAQGAVGIGADPSHEGRPRPGGDANGSGSSQGALREIARHSAETPGNWHPTPHQRRQLLQVSSSKNETQNHWLSTLLNSILKYVVCTAYCLKNRMRTELRNQNNWLFV